MSILVRQSPSRFRERVRILTTNDFVGSFFPSADELRWPAGRRRAAGDSRRPAHRGRRRVLDRHRRPRPGQRARRAQRRRLAVPRPARAVDRRRGGRQPRTRLGRRPPAPLERRAALPPAGREPAAGLTGHEDALRGRASGRRDRPVAARHATACSLRSSPTRSGAASSTGRSWACGRASRAASPRPTTL